MTRENDSPTRRPVKDRSAEPIVVECDLPEPPEKVWRALTVPELLAEWLMPNDIRPQVGERFRLQPEVPGTAPGPQDAGRAAESIDCEVLEAEPNRVLRYRWSTRESERGSPDRVLDSVVSFELTRTADGGTHLRVVHGDFQFRAPNVIQLTPATTGTSATAPMPETGKAPVAMAGEAMRWAA